MQHRAAVSWATLSALALIKLAVHFATSSGYGYFRDELYYLASTEHLAWGYVEHPPLSIALLWLSRTLLGDSLLAVRTVPALAGAATIVVSGLLARELGGRRPAQLIAGLATLVTPFYLAIAHFYSMNALDVLAWALLGLLAARALLHEEPQAWLAFGLVAGIGLLNKVSVGFFGFALVVGLVLTPQRRHFANPMLWVGGAIALLVFLPHLLWQAEHGFPTLEFQANARADKNLPLSPLEFGLQQLQMGNVILLPLWGLGLAALLRGSRWKSLRPLGLIYPVLFVLFISTNAKAYYLAPIYTMLFAAGAVAAEPFLSRASWRTAVAAIVMILFSLPAVPIVLPILPPESLVAYQKTIGLEVPQMETGEQAALQQAMADMHGWTELVDTVERVVSTLSAEEQRSAVILATNYGEAGAIEVLGAERGIPPVVCGHNSYWDWRPDELSSPVIALRRSREELEVWFDSVERVDTVRCQWCMPYQDESPVHVARGLKIPLEQFWREIRRFR